MPGSSKSWAQKLKAGPTDFGVEPHFSDLVIRETTFRQRPGRVLPLVRAIFTIHRVQQFQGNFGCPIRAVTTVDNILRFAQKCAYGHLMDLATTEIKCWVSYKPVEFRSLEVRF